MERKFLPKRSNTMLEKRGNMNRGVKIGRIVFFLRRQETRVRKGCLKGVRTWNRRNFAFDAIDFWNGCHSGSQWFSNFGLLLVSDVGQCSTYALTYWIIPVVDLVEPVRWEDIENCSVPDYLEFVVGTTVLVASCHVQHYLDEAKIHNSHPWLAQKIDSDSLPDDADTTGADECLVVEIVAGGTHFGHVVPLLKKHVSFLSEPKINSIQYIFSLKKWSSFLKNGNEVKSYEFDWITNSIR